MTREEAYNRIDAIIALHEIDDDYVTITSLLDYDALRMARKALEQEPCEDCISRKEVLFLPRKKTYDFMGGVDFSGVDVDLIKELPSVKPKERTGEWINIINQDLHDYRTGNKLCFECSNCKSQFTYSSNYCPSCGRSMMAKSEEEE